MFKFTDYSLFFVVPHQHLTEIISNCDPVIVDFRSPSYAVADYFRRSGSSSFVLLSLNAWIYFLET